MNRESLTAIINRLAQPLQPKPTGVAVQLQTLPDIRCVLFDIYGTLLVSGVGDIGATEEGVDDSDLESVLASVGIAGNLEAAAKKLPSLKERLIRLEHEKARQNGVGYPEVEIRQIWADAFAELSIEGAIDEDVLPESIECFALEYECKVNPTWPMSGAVETLQQLRDRGILLGIVSNAQFYTPVICKTLFGAGFDDLGFHPGLCAWSYLLRLAKPSTQMFASVLRVLADEFSIQPSSVLYVGNDMLKDVWTASQVGCKTTLFAGDARSLQMREDDERCKDLQPDAVIDRLSQIVEIVSI